MGERFNRVRDFDEAVEHFETHWIDRIDRENEWFATDPKDLREATKRAALSDQRLPGSDKLTRHLHQRRIRKGALGEAANLLAGQGRSLRDCMNFDDLYHVIDSLIGDVRGIGDVTVYDITERVALYQNIGNQNVYLHAGVREGAIAVRGPTNARYLPLSKFPEPFRRLNGYQAESLLCIYKGVFEEIREKGWAIAKRPADQGSCIRTSIRVC